MIAILPVIGTLFILFLYNEVRDQQLSRLSVTQYLNAPVLLQPQSVQRPIHTAERELHSQATVYCHQSLLKSVTGAEGSLPSQNNGRYELVQVHMLLRHGDRSQATDLRLKPTVRYECGMVDRDKQWKELQDISLLPHPRTAYVKNLHEPLFRGFQPQPCQSGQLTFIGLQQHRKIGMFMQHQYSGLLQTIKDARDVFVQSTDYTRTIESAASFLVGFLSNQPHLNKLIPIHVSRSINLPTPPPRLHAIYKGCRRLGAIWQTELAKQPRNKRDVLIFHQLATVLNVDYRYIGMTDLFDLVWCRLCHNHTLPCGQQSCPNTTFLLEGARAAHRAFNRLYPTTLSIVKTQAYLSNTVIEGMEQAIRFSNSHSYMKFLLSFAHDSVLAPLLNSLGVRQHVWLPYATRIVLELWRDRNAPAYSDEVYYVRLLLNGIDVTHRLPAPTEFHANRQLVSYTGWKKSLLTGPFRELSSYKEICGIS